MTDQAERYDRERFKQSGIGRELAKEALDAYRLVKTVKMTFGEIPKF